MAISRTGALCGRRAIQGERLRPLAGKGCGVAEPVRVRSVSGVEISPPAIMDCPEAVALDDWVGSSALPAWGRLGRGLSKVEVGTGFSCKPEDAAGHGAGQALDVTGFGLRNGIEVSVAKGWRDAVAGQVLRRARDGACQTFPTVLSPDAGGAEGAVIHLGVVPGGRCR